MALFACDRGKFQIDRVGESTARAIRVTELYSRSSVPYNRAPFRLRIRSLIDAITRRALSPKYLASIFTFHISSLTNTFIGHRLRLCIVARHSLRNHFNSFEPYIFYIPVKFLQIRHSGISRGRRLRIWGQKVTIRNGDSIAATIRDFKINNFNIIQK